jgi:hemerythrin superfamily protein
MTTDTQDIVNVILTQHEQVKSLLTKVASGQANVADDFCELRRSIAVHETAEEEVVYPVLRTLGEQARAVVEARLKEEAEGTKVLFELEKLDAGSAEFDKLFAKFRQAVLEHAGKEENEVIPLLRQQPEDRRRSMAKTFQAAEQAAPTHAHPHAPTSATGNILTGPALAIMDKVRDAIHSRA